MIYPRLPIPENPECSLLVASRSGMTHKSKPVLRNQRCHIDISRSVHETLLLINGAIWAWQRVQFSSETPKAPIAICINYCMTSEREPGRRVQGEHRNHIRTERGVDKRSEDKFYNCSSTRCCKTVGRTNRSENADVSRALRSMSACF